MKNLFIYLSGLVSGASAQHPKWVIRLNDSEPEELPRTWIARGGMVVQG